MSFQHEVYPEELAVGPAPSQELEERPLSRQVLIVQELEIRDRLATSQINKFLHLHTSERLPRRTHSNMVRAGGAQGDVLTHCSRAPTHHTRTRVVGAWGRAALRWA